MKMKLQILFVFLAFCFAANGLELTSKSFKDCGLKNIKFVNVEPCQSEPCTLVRGSTVKVNGQFVSHHDAPDSDCKLELKANLGFWFTVKTVDVCQSDSGEPPLKCPFKKNDVKDFLNELLVEESFSERDNLPLRIRLVCNGQVDEVVCADVTVNIK